MKSHDKLVSTTADIVVAHVSTNAVALSDLPTLITKIHSALAQLAEPVSMMEPKRRQPFVSVRSSVKLDRIQCLICGTAKKMLKGHIAKAHGLTPQEYRAEFDLRHDYPMTAANYIAVRRQLAKANGLGTKSMRAAISAGKLASAIAKKHAAATG